MHETSRQRVSPHGLEVRDLLRRYPRLEPRESERLLEAFKSLTILELGLMMSDESLRARLDAFVKDHRRELRAPFWHPIVFLGMPVSILILLVYGLWQTAVGG